MQQVGGIDEVGRGSLAGPVVVCAVSGYEDFTQVMLGLQAVLRRVPTDSKKLTRLQRERGAAYLQSVVQYGLGSAAAGEIDELGIVSATALAATRALDSLPQLPDRIVADAGLHHQYEKIIPTEWFIKGDETVPHILCASLIAKVNRDKSMTQLAEQFPEYCWDTNMGYGSSAHLAAIRKHALTPQHRVSFCRHIS